jgi:hypothetical protein
MKSRERRYLILKRFRKKHRAQIDMMNKAWHSYMLLNVTGSWVGKTADGRVVARILSTEEILELLEKEQNGEVIPEEYTIYRDSV